MRLRSILLLLVLALAAAPAAGQKLSVKDLPPKYRTWLEEEVVYIIGPKEKEVFLQLSNDREREMFVLAFWKARDEDPTTEENKFKDEHYRRIEYANLWFGRGRKAGGWRSDMGRIYITLGEPKTIDRFENQSNLYPIIIWFYSGMSGASLPSSFNVMFFKKDDAGDYIIYSPIRDGPQKLMPFYNGDMTNYLQAWGELRNIDPTLSEIAMSLIPGEYITGGNPTQSSDILLGNRIPRSAYDKVKSAYAEKLLKYKDVIEVEYTANYIESDALIQVRRDEAGRAFVHYLVEPARLSIERYEGLYRTTFNVNGIVSDASGRTVFQFDRRVPVELRPDQFEKVNNRLVSFQDAFPLIEGEYKFSLLWKNTVSREFTSVEATIKVPSPRDLSLSTPLLANRVVRNPAFRGQVKPFTVGETQLVASPRNDFVSGDVMTVECELGGLTDALRRDGRVLVTLTKDDQVVASKTRPIGTGVDALHVLEEFPLAALSPAYYMANVSILDAAEAPVVTAKTAFYISLNSSLPRSWILYSPLPPAGDPTYSNVFGNQHLMAGHLDRARTLLEAAYRRAPDSAAFALDYCRALFAAKDYEGVRAVAEPFYRDQQKYEFAQYLGESAQVLGRYAEAITYYKDYLTAFGTNLNVLNSIGECYVKVGDSRSALTAWKKSLELNPNQPELKKKVADLEAKTKEPR